MANFGTEEKNDNIFKETKKKEEYTKTEEKIPQPKHQIRNNRANGNEIQ